LSRCPGGQGADHHGCRRRGAWCPRCVCRRMYGGRRLRCQAHHQGPPRRLGPQVPHQVGSLTLVALHVWFVIVVTQPSMTVLGHLGRYEATCGETSAREQVGPPLVVQSAQAQSWPQQLHVVGLVAPMVNTGEVGTPMALGPAWWPHLVACRPTPSAWLSVGSRVLKARCRPECASEDPR
jgi:hypothetical protein